MSEVLTKEPNHGLLWKICFQGRPFVFWRGEVQL